MDVLSKYIWQLAPLNIHFVKSVAQLCAYKCFNIDPTINYATPIREFIEAGHEPQDETEAKRIRPMTHSYIILDEIIYKKGFSTPLLRCIAPPKTTTILIELHEGYTAFHKGAISIVRKALNQRYYWPTIS